MGPRDRGLRSLALNLAPHPDDELIPAGGTLLLLKESGWAVANHACGLGRPADQARRQAELIDACNRAGFHLIVHEPPLPLSRDDDLTASEDQLVDSLAALLEELSPTVLLAPHPHDGHHAHELVGRAVVRAARAGRRPLTVWWWSLWRDPGRVTTIVPIDRVLGLLLHALEAHAGENTRNDYPRLVEARAAANAVLGAERVYDFGSAGIPDRHVELLTETVFDGESWWFGQPRQLDAESPGPSAPTGERAERWLGVLP